MDPRENLPAIPSASRANLTSESSKSRTSFTPGIRPGGTAPFSKRCNGCPLRARSTPVPEKSGYLRPSVERTIAWLTRGKARRVPYRGITRNQQWLTTRTAAINLRRLTNLGLAHTTTGWATNPA